MPFSPKCMKCSNFIQNELDKLNPSHTEIAKLYDLELYKLTYGDIGLITHGVSDRSSRVMLGCLSQASMSCIQPGFTNFRDSISNEIWSPNQKNENAHSCVWCVINPTSTCYLVWCVISLTSPLGQQADLKSCGFDRLCYNTFVL